METRDLKLTDRYSLHWVKRCCGCWCLDWLSYEADIRHLHACETHKNGEEWYKTAARF